MPDEHDKRHVPDELQIPLALSPHRIAWGLGRRGLFLLCFGVTWLVIGLSVILVPTTITNQSLFYEMFPGWLRLGLWAVPGLVAMAAAFFRRPGQDVLGFSFLIIPAAVRGVSFLAGWIVYLADVAPGSPFGWAGFVVYAALVVAIAVVASWPEPRLPMALLVKEADDAG
jgi:hypothetical protein